MKKARNILFGGLLMQLVGFLWDLKIHSQSGVEEGLDEFFSVPAHDLVILGYIICGIGFLVLYQSIKKNNGNSTIS